MNESAKILYHYTSIEGLIGIIESKSIWATNILYLNDASELDYAKALFEEQIINFQNKIGRSDYLFDWFFKSSIEDIKSISPNTYVFFICSFSERNDLLSQWRGYCPSGIGVSLGFKFNDLRKSLKGYTFSIMPCIYKKNEQVSKINNLIENVYDKFKFEMTQHQDNIYRIILNKSALEFYTEFIRMAPGIKHPKFKEEKEWRIVTWIDTKDQLDKIKFRPGKSMVIPYIDIPLPREGENLILKKIVVGPTHEPELSKTAIEMLLKSNNVKFNKVQRSTIPYRNW
jgi:hypothetical protein